MSILIPLSKHMHMHRHVSSHHWTVLITSVLQVHADTAVMRPSQFQLTGHTTLRRIGIFAPRRSNQPTLTPLAPEPRLTTSSSLISSASASSSSSSSSASSPISVRLCIHSSLRRNDSAWTPDQDSLLLDLRTQGRTWTEIGQVLHRSRQSCNRRFDSVLDPKNGAAFWNDHPDRIRLLKELVSQHLSWKVIAQQLGTNASSCKHQWKLLNQQEKLEAEEVKTRTTSLEPVMQFRADDQQLLKEAVEEYGTDQWQTISEKVFGPQYSPAYLRRQYTKLEQRRKVWTGQQEEALETAVTERYQSHRYSLSWDASGVDILSDEDWKVIAGSIAGEHTAAECREKWLRLQVTIMSLRTRTATPENDEGNNPPGQSSKPRASQGGSRVAWTEEESQQLESIINSIRADSKDALVEWDKVAKQMDNKFTRQQCKSRWNRVLRLNSGDSTGAWSEEEIENLLKGVCDLGPQWTEIRREWVHGRSPTYIQGKWASIRGRLHQEMVVQRWTWAEVCVERYGQAIGQIMGELPNRWPLLCEIPSRQMKKK